MLIHDICQHLPVIDPGLSIRRSVTREDIRPGQSDQIVESGWRACCTGGKKYWHQQDENPDRHDQPPQFRRQMSAPVDDRAVRKLGP